MYNGLSQVYCIKPEGRFQEYTKGKAASFLFFSKMIARLESIPTKTSQNKYPAHTQTKQEIYLKKIFGCISIVEFLFRPICIARKV